MAKEVESALQVGTASLYTKTWTPDGPPVAKLIFVHGFNDHINRYYELFPTLASRGIEVHGFDQRGWGRSVHTPSDRGLTGGTSQVISDIVAVIKTQLPCTIPLFLMGHSMGGQEILILASDPKHADLMKEIRGWLLESPYIGLDPKSQPSNVVVFFGRLAGSMLPHKQRTTILPPKDLTRDPEVIKSLEEDKLLHGFGTLEGLSGMLDRSAELSSGKAKLNKGAKSLWLSHGTADMGTSYAASKHWYETETKNVPDKEFKTYEGWYHQLHADLPDDRSVFAKDVGDWILQRIGPEVRDSRL